MKSDDIWTFAKCLAEFGITLELRDGKLFATEKVTNEEAIAFIRHNRADIIKELRGHESK